MLKKLQTILLFLLISGTSFSQVPNGTFESWTDSLPDLWDVNNFGDSLVTITQSADAHSGTSAIRGDVIDYHGGFVPPSFHTHSASGLGYNINSRFVGLTGWYKSELIGTNYITATVTITASNGISMGIGFSKLPAQATYTRFYIPISYTGAGVGRYALIAFSMVDSTGLGFNLGSNFVIDDLNLELVSDVGQINTSAFTVEPNPVVNQININGEFKGGQVYDVCLFNSIGKLVIQKSIECNSSSMPPIDVSILPEDTYILLISDAKTTTSQRIIISR